jgi:hypothetical protein
VQTLVEAMAMTARDEPGWRLDVVGEWESVDGWLVEESTAAELVAGIRGVQRDADTYAGFCAAARHAYEEPFSETAFATGMAAPLEEAAGARAASPRARHDVGEVQAGPGPTSLPR